MNEVLANPAICDDPAAVGAAAAAAGLDGHVLFSTSGTSGVPKWVALSRAALECSADAVNRCLGASADDVWLRALPEFHVGGYAIGVRASLAGCEVRVLEGKWDPARFCAAADGATRCSLVPTQVFDLVEGGFKAPPSLRTVLVGGGTFSHRLRVQAEALGWPVRATYGMTEAGSSVAIADAEGSLRLLDIWQARIGADGELEISGPALFTRYLDSGAAGEWFATGDRAALEGGVLSEIGRCDSVVKVLGERVDLDGLQARLPDGFVVVAAADARAGNRLVLVGEHEVGEVLNRFNDEVAGFERLSEFVRVDRLRRSPLGKLLRDQLSENTSEA